MTGEICLFHKYGFCKNGDKCTKAHLTEECRDRECDSKKCDKRHPRPCKHLLQNGFCKFNLKCSYSHRLPKMIEDQNTKIEALEKKIESQNEMISDLKIKLLEGQKMEVLKLQNQINTLKIKINEKEDLIRKLDNGDVIDSTESQADDEINVNTLQEDSVFNASPNPASASVRYENFIKNSLRHLEVMELDIKKSRKISVIRDKYKSYSDKIEHEFQKYEIKSTIYDMAVKRLKDGLKFQENEITEVKDHYLQCIFKCRMSLNS